MVHFGFLSTYPPTRCGLATFTESLATALIRGKDADASIVRVFDEGASRPLSLLGAHSTVAADLVAGDATSRAAATAALNRSDVVIVQHEYGIYGGRDGDEVIEVLAALDAPCIVVLHTVLAAPTPHQREVLHLVCRLAAVVVVMTENARGLLVSGYDVPDAKVSVIPHGVPDWEPALVDAPHRGRRVLTWGLLSPGKGIEWGIRAMAQLADLGTGVEYVIAGQTHPKVLARSGEAYRDMLTATVRELGLTASVTFDDHYRSAAELAELLRAADVALLPYDSRDQATSGVLVEAIAAGLPVVATRFPHAVELLSGGAGLLVDHQNPTAIAESLRTILTATGLAERMHAAALQDAQRMPWSAVAAQYRALSEQLLAVQAA